MLVPWSRPALPEGSTGATERPCPVVTRPEASRDELFAELYREHFVYVWKSARRLGVQPPEVDDVVQETFVAFYRLFDTFDDRRPIRSWLFSLLYRRVLHHRRSHRRRTAFTVDTTNIDVLPGSPAQAPDRRVETNETVRMLEEIFEKLDPDKRAVLVLAEVEEKPISEIAQILDINVNTAASRLRVAREHVDASLARIRARDGWRTK
ncbi:MAG: polymerase sigma factor RpoE [Labilithrix sp.]|nr:polymerase sigma factor RpoE [Labilithrix sp.]